MKNLFFTSIVVLITFFTSAQNGGIEYSYRHYEGTLGPYTGTADLVISGERINGRACFHKENASSSEWLLQGKIDTYGIAELEVYISDEPAGYMSGALKTDFNGFYREANGRQGRNFQLNETYDESIRFNGYTLALDSALLDSTGSPRASLEISLLLPENVDSNFFMREAILQVFFSNSDLSSLPDHSILPVFSNMYFSKYIEANKDIYAGGYSFNWEMNSGSSILLNQRGLVCYRANSYAYTGGAHGIGISRFLVFDTKTKKKLSLDDIFIEGYEVHLEKLLEEKYRNMRFLGENESLTAAGLFDDTIYPTDNFRISENGIGFFYNPYELAPYSMGSITISLENTEIIDLLKEDAAVKRLGWVE